MMKRIQTIIGHFRSLNKNERTAFVAFRACRQTAFVQHLSRPKDVSFEKSECEQVDFDEFWLGKMQKFGWVRVTLLREFKAVGLVGQPTAREYNIYLTDEGRFAIDVYWDTLEIIYDQQNYSWIWG